MFRPISINDQIHNRLTGRRPAIWKLYIAELLAVEKYPSAAQAQLPAAIYNLRAIKVRSKWSPCLSLSLTVRLD